MRPGAERYHQHANRVAGLAPQYVVLPCRRAEGTHEAEIKAVLFNSKYLT